MFIEVKGVHVLADWCVLGSVEVGADKIELGKRGYVIGVERVVGGGKASLIDDWVVMSSSRQMILYISFLGPLCKISRYELDRRRPSQVHITSPSGQMTNVPLWVSMNSYGQIGPENV